MYTFDDTPHEYVRRFIGCTAIIVDQEDILWWECAFHACDYEGKMMFGWDYGNYKYVPVVF